MNSLVCGLCETVLDTYRLCLLPTISACVLAVEVASSNSSSRSMRCFHIVESQARKKFVPFNREKPWFWQGKLWNLFKSPNSWILHRHIERIIYLMWSLPDYSHIFSFIPLHQSPFDLDLKLPLPWARFVTTKCKWQKKSVFTIWVLK